MRFNKEKGIRKAYIIDNEEVSEEQFYYDLKEALMNDYGCSKFEEYLNEEYCETWIEEYCYTPSELLYNMGDYEEAYTSWKHNTVDIIIGDFEQGSINDMFIDGFHFEIRKVEDTSINIQLKMEEVKRLYFTLNINYSIANNLLAKTFLNTLEQLIEEKLHESEDLEEC